MIIKKKVSNLKIGEYEGLSEYLGGAERKKRRMESDVILFPVKKILKIKYGC